MERRKFLIGCGAGAALLASSQWRMMASPLSGYLPTDNDHTFVVLFLRGGCDGLQLLGPISDEHYQDARPNSLKLLDGQGYRIDQEYQHTGFSFHPQASALKELYDNKDLAIIHACGLTNGTRSHFDAMNLIERGIEKNGSGHEGWMARYLNAIETQSYVPGVSVSSNLADAFTGYAKAASINNLADYNLMEGLRVPQLIQRMYDGDPIMGNAATQTLETIKYLQTNLTEGQRSDLKRGISGYPKDWSSRELSRSLQTVAQLIKMDAGAKIINVDYGGWDTHERQANVFPNLVKGLSESIGAFYNDIAAKKNKVTVLVMSEFGRRLRANKSGGTDHGHGNLMMVLGGNVNGGKMYGEWPGLHPKTLDRGVDLAVRTDYRNVLANIMQKSMKFSDTGLIFPDFEGYSDMEFLR
jgi:uncharacterized protein (DUF1501 family)